MDTSYEYADALEVLKENNPGLVKTIDKLSRAIVPSHGLVFPDEPDARAFGTHPETQEVIRMFWRGLFHKPNCIELIASVPRDDSRYSGTIIDPSVRMSIYLLENNWCLELGREAPKNKVFSCVHRNNPPFQREDDLVPALYSLAKSAGIKRVFDYTVQKHPFKTTTKRVRV